MTPHDTACIIIQTLPYIRRFAGKTLVIKLGGAASDAEARAAAKAVAENNLVKCSWYGADPYWGRLLAAAGSCGVAFETGKTFVSYGGTVVSRGGIAVEHDENTVNAHMLAPEIDIEIGLCIGAGSARMIGIDLGPGYIKENSVTS